MNRLALILAISLLSGCGQVAPLQPGPGERMPVKPLMANRTPTSEELLTPPPYARPERVDELIKRSQPRRPDRFDLPPPDGGAAPEPVLGDEETSSEEAGPVTPQ